MGDAGGEASDGGEAVAQTEFALQAANLGEVGKGVDVADGCTAGALERAAADAEEFFGAAGSARPHLAARCAGQREAVEEELVHVEPGEILLAAAQQTLAAGLTSLMAPSRSVVMRPLEMERTMISCSTWRFSSSKLLSFNATSAWRMRLASLLAR